MNLVKSALCFTQLVVNVLFSKDVHAQANKADLKIPKSPDASIAVVQTPACKPVSEVVSGLITSQIAIFIPQGLDPARLPVSLALLKSPQIAAALPANWPVRPRFSTDGKLFRAFVEVGPEVDLYGGGEVTGPLRRNGQTIMLWNTDNFRYDRDGGQRLYQSHPWIMGVRPDGSAFGVIFDSTWQATLSCSNGIEFTSTGPAFPVVIIDRESPQAVIESLAELTGKMPLPPRWALGYQQCRWSYMSAKQVREVADGFRSRNIPCDVIWMDIDYMDAFRVFTFNSKEFSDPRGLNDYLHLNGFKSVWMIDPGVKVDANYSVYTDGHQKDVFVKTATGEEFHGNVWPGSCAFPDFTRPETRRWWAALYRNYLTNGIDGVWNDMNEPSVFEGVDYTMPADNQHRGGDGLPPGPHRQYHNVFGMLMAQATRNGMQAAHPDKRPFVLTRSNFIGGQRYAATWTGDNVSSDAYMKLAVPMSLTLGISGQPFNGPDMGGFDGNATADLWSDWVGFGTLFPFCRGHASKDTNEKEPWAFGAATENTARIALDRRYRLLPYLYTVFDTAARTGLPIMRPVFMADIKDRSLRSEQQAFMLGENLLVVPRFAQNVHLPKGKWPIISLMAGDLTDAPQAILYMRPGAIIPLGRVIQNTTEKSFDPLTLLVCLDQNGHAEGTLYEDAGDGYGYRNGDFVRTTFHAERKGGRLVVTVIGREGERKNEWQDFVVQEVK